ncbi:kinase-like protein [Thozetella sp. PMI_491]|nr:kinase-like protein [Thozetella sp. PMI_491]
MTAGPPQPMSSSAASDKADDDLHDKHVQLRDAAAAIAAAVNNSSAQVNASLNLSYSTANAAEPEAVAKSPAGKTTISATPLITDFQFQSQTTAPTPPQRENSAGPTGPQKPGELTTDLPPRSPFHRSPLGGNVARLRTDVHPATPLTPTKTEALTRPSAGFLQHKTSTSSLRPISRTPSLKAGGAFAFGTASAASSTVPSPIITAMGDVTPLPSPLLSSDSPGPWKSLRPTSRDAHIPVPMSPESALVTSTGESIAAAMANQSKRRAYASLASSSGSGESNNEVQQSDKPTTQIHTRNRSTSEYIPDPVHLPKRMITVSGSHVKVDTKPMRREPHLSEARGLTPVEKPPTPPPSESSLSAADSTSLAGSGSSMASKKSKSEIFEAFGRRDRKRRRWRAIRQLGQGTFSRVMLATSQIPSSASDDEESSGGNSMPSPEAQPHRRTLVAVKVCEHGPRGGASEDRIEMSLKRELEIMQSIDHPSLVHLKAWNIEPTRAILVLSYCPGGDLFDVASTHRDSLTPPLLRRIFAELIGAVQYLHERRIVHRDIKLENVLVNFTPSELSDGTIDWSTYPYSVVTLTDLGLSRRIADDEKLETRCGSDDYAAPEVIMGQPYDGRATDAWSLGVLLYALLEGRLPFDPPPGIGDHAMQMRLRSRTSHRIARAEWRWIEYGVSENEEGEGDHEADVKKFAARGLTGAMEVVEGLLKRARSRWPVTKVADNEWVSGAIQVEGGLSFHEEEEGEEVL